MMDEKFIEVLYHSSINDYNSGKDTTNWNRGFIIALKIILEVKE